MATVLATLFWGAMIINQRDMGSIQARQLPDYNDAADAVDNRLGEKNLEESRGQVEDRFDLETKSKDGELGDIHSGDEGAQGFLAETATLQVKYYAERDQQSDATTATTYFVDAYNNMLVEHRLKLNDITDVQQDTNDLLQEIDDMLEEYVTTLFIASR